jgi:hypothetical protein
MLTKIGKNIEIRAGGASKLAVTRCSDAPGVVVVRDGSGRVECHLTDVEPLVAALRRARDEDIEYRTHEWEDETKENQ